MGTDGTRTRTPPDTPSQLAGSLRVALERQLASVVAFLDDYGLDVLLDVAVARFVDPPKPRNRHACWAHIS